MGDSRTRGGHPGAADPRRASAPPRPFPASARPRGALHLGALSAVAIGGAIGTLLRAGLDAALPHAPTGLAASTLLVNVLGGAVLGVLVGWASPRVPGWARAGLGTGLLGSFTTYSAFAVSIVLLAEAGSAAGALATVVLTLVLGIGSAAAGHVIGLRLAAAGRAATVAPWPEVDE